MFFPHRPPMVFHTSAVLHGILLNPLRRLLGLAAIYDLWASATFVVGVWATFLLAMEVLKDGGAAFLAACLYTSRPLACSGSKATSSSSPPTGSPLIILSLLELRRGGFRHSLAAGILLGLAIWTDLHHPVHPLIFPIATLARWLSTGRASGDPWRGIFRGLAGTAFTAVLLPLPLWLSA